MFRLIDNTYYKKKYIYKDRLIYISSYLFNNIFFIEYININNFCYNSGIRLIKNFKR